MYSYEWDKETGGYLLNSSSLTFSKEPRPVYYKELDILGFDSFWNYDKDESYPYMWAEANNYYYRGRLVAKTKGGSLYAAPEIIEVEPPEPEGSKLKFVDVERMVEKNEHIMEGLIQTTIKKIYNTYIEYQKKIDVFYVAFSGGKDSITVLDLVQRALPHNGFKVVFGDTKMEFPDTYEVINQVAQYCSKNGIAFYTSHSDIKPDITWENFGPPATSIRWCCSVHKTSPQIKLLREVTENNQFAGMAFTGVRGDESLSRSEYDDISFGEKHQGQFSCHPLLEWNSAELFLYIFGNGLILNESYKKGNSRAGCLVCPMSSGRHEYLKRQCYQSEVDKFISLIASTSGKTNYSDSQMTEFIDAGLWKTRKTGRELNFGQDCFIVQVETNKTRISVFRENPSWEEWAKTIGKILKKDNETYSISYKDKLYDVLIVRHDGRVDYFFPNCYTSKDDIKFISLFRSVVVKSLYCIACGACEAECPYGCIDLSNGVHISDTCVHCHSCHEIHEHCLRYNSIRNKIGAEKHMKGLDRYFSFGIRSSWLDTYIRYDGESAFWETDGNGEVANKKKDAFLNFVKDAGLGVYDKLFDGDKYTKCRPTLLTQTIKSIGSDNPTSWGFMLANLACTPEINWYIKHVNLDEQQTSDNLKLLLSDVMENDAKGLGKRNITDALKILLIKTPLGAELGLGICDFDEKISSTGKETIVLRTFMRSYWKNPNSLVILYSLYKFAEACGNYYQFTLTRLLNHGIDSDGVSPTEIFGIDRETMERILNGLSVNYPEFISASFTLDLDNITLRDNKTSQDVLGLF